jgi:hypothetical protein
VGRLFFLAAGIDGGASWDYFSAMKNALAPILWLLVAFNVDVIAGQGYLWPMKISPELTSKFCDYRSGHFHSGLDIRTRGKTGFRLYAIDDGYVFRAVTSFRGYGKALYLKLPDGRIVVYGHMSGFTEGVENRILAEQLKSKKYSQDLYFTRLELPVRRGDVVGYSGESGSGAPHLHFEIRSPENNPINPLLAGMKVADTRAPEFHRLAVKYFEAGYLPTGSYDNHDFHEFLKALDTGKNIFVIGDTIIGAGQMLFAVSGGDRIAGTGYLYGFYGLRLYIEDSLTFEMNSDSLAFANTRQLSYIRDLESIRIFEDRKKLDNDADIFFRLYVPPLSRQFFWPGQMVNAGIVEPTRMPGRVRRVRVEAFDEAGNSATLNFVIKEPELTIRSSQDPVCWRYGEKINFAFLSPSRPISEVLEYRSTPDGEFRAVASSMSIGTGMHDERGYYSDTVSAAIARAERIFRLRYLDATGGTSPWLYFIEESPKERLSLKGAPDLLRLEFALGERKTLRAHFRSGLENYREAMVSAGPGLYRCNLRDKFLNGSVDISIEDGPESIFDTSLILYAVKPRATASIYSPDSILQVMFEAASAYGPAYVFASNGRREATPDGPALIFDIQPANMVVDAPVRFVFDVARLGLSGSKVGVYGQSEGEWSFIKKIEGGKLEANGIGLGRVAIFEDNNPPTIASVTPARSTKARKPVISCILSDDLSGMALENGISMSIDGNWVPAEFDFDTDKLRYKVRNILSIGRHSIEIEATDNQGNSATKKTFFSVIGE